tara:strand:- start:340 stop:1230 length:891 start_codon:yes stop_codon:yes gene_type:complete
MPSSFFVNNGGTTAARSTIADDLTASSNSKSDAQKLAINAEDAQFTLSDGTTTGNSALHYSAKAAASATSASGSASTATQQAGLANDAKLAAQTAKAEAVVAFGDSVQLTGDQTIAGAKTFSSSINVTGTVTAGNVLVGCTSLPSASVTGSGFSATTLGRRILSMSSSSTGGGVQLATFFNPNGQVGSIATSGSSTAYNTSSDYRLKTDAQPMTGATARLKQLNPVNFEWISDGTRVDGFLAHEAQAIVPESVIGTKDALDEEGNPDYQGIDQAKLVPLLVATIQELEARITALEA